MAVSKRTRFEVLRRDNHSCRYCGESAPDVKITVDHVLPVALGGTDDPTNLVAACRDCNAGKTSTSPGERLVADVDQDALRWAAARQRVLEERRKAIAANKRVTAPFLKSWKAWDKDTRYLPPDWRDSLLIWMADGLSMDEICTYLGIALSKREIRHEVVFRYMAGIIRNKIAEIDTATRAAVEPRTRAAESPWTDAVPDPINWILMHWIDTGGKPGIYESPWKSGPSIDLQGASR